jgi:ferrous iron transport protein A
MGLNPAIEQCCQGLPSCESKKLAEPSHLGDLQVGDKARVVGYNHSHAQYLNRLLALGLTRGSQICVVRKAPLGDPVDITVRGYSLTLRREEAAVLLLEKVP